MISSPEVPEPMSGPRRAAILLVALGEQAGAELIKALSDEEVQVVSREIARLHKISSEQAEAVLEEFHQMVVGRDFVVTGGLEYARKMLQGAFGQDTAKKIYDRLIRVLGSDVASFDILHKADPQQLAKFIHSEHPQTIALILSHLSASQAAVFEDLVLLDANGTKELMGRVDRKQLTLALKGTSDQLRNHFLEAMSQRAGEMLKEDMEALGPVKIKDVEAAQQAIITLVRQLESGGLLNMNGAGGDQYVV